MMGSSKVLDATRPFIPPALSGLTFICGAVMLLGSSIRLSGQTLLMLEEIFPAELIELSHILGGVIGVILIILSFALWQRIRAALWLTSSLCNGQQKPDTFLVLCLVKQIIFYSHIRQTLSRFVPLSDLENYKLEAK